MIRILRLALPVALAVSLSGCIVYGPPPPPFFHGSGYGGPGDGPPGYWR